MNFRFTATSALLIAALAVPAFAGPIGNTITTPPPRPANFSVDGRDAPTSVAPPNAVTYTAGEMAAISRYNMAARKSVTTPAARRTLDLLRTEAVKAARAAVNRAAQGAHVASYTRSEALDIRRYKTALASAKTAKQRENIRKGRLGVAFIRAIDARNMRTFNMSQRNERNAAAGLHGYSADPMTCNCHD